MTTGATTRGDFNSQRDILESPGYWAIASDMIDGQVERIHTAVRREQVDHVSVFAIACVPLLVYLGFALDDMVGADVYERHRASDSWLWDDDHEPHRFTHDLVDSDDGAAEAVSG